MANFYDDNDDLRFYVERGIDWERLVPLVEPQLPAPDGPADHAEVVESYRDVLNLVGQFTADRIAPAVAGIDRAGLQFSAGTVHAPPALDAIFAEIKDMGLHGMCLPRALGGMNCPVLLYFLSEELIARADVSIMTHNGFHGAIALAMLLYSLAEGTCEFDPATGAIVSTRFDREIAEIIAGDAWGSMDITEPNAGSDMAALTTRAVQDDAGTWRVTGEKIFITSGHGKYHFVIARTEDPVGGDATAGLRALSLFLVPLYEEDGNGGRTYLGRIDRIEEKLGHHASATCALSFDGTPAQLIGRRGEGFKHMLLLMNNARLGVGFEALGLCEAAYRLAAAYAAGRQSMGKTIDRHELIADYLDAMRTDIQGIRALAVDGAFHEEISHRLRVMEAAGGRFADEAKARREEHRASLSRSRRVTPLLKYLAAEKSVEMARMCLQIHGGVGYSTEYGAEKLVRDALVTPIYEGTSQIQALMAMKDTLGAAMANPQAFVLQVAQARWRSLSARDSLERRVARLQSVALGATQHLLSRTAITKLRALTNQPIRVWPKELAKNWNPKRDFGFALLHAERLTKILADVAICEALLDQARAHADRRDVLERYLERAEPRCRCLHDEIVTTGERLLASLHRAEQAEAGGTAASA